MTPAWPSSVLLIKMFVFRMGPDSSIMGERRHKDEIDSADDSDGKGDNDEVRVR